MKKISLILALMLFFSAILISCKKDAGTGGNSSVFGKVHVKDYNGTFTVLQEEYYGPDVDVYIIYGDNITYDDHIKTSYDGTFEFKYLRPGKYHVYAYSKDSTLLTNAVIPVIKDIEITKNKQSIEVPEIEIFK